MNFQRRRSFADASVDITTDARVLFDAVRHGKNHLVRFILEASAVDIVNSRDLHGKTPLMACCYTKEEGARDNTVRLLLSHGADVNLTDDSRRTVLSYVCERRCNDILRILIKEHNIDPDISDKSGNTPLIYAAMVGNDIACDILLRHFRRLGLSIDSVNDEGFTALLIAAKHGNITCAQILIGQGKASLHYRDVKHGLSVEEWLGTNGISIQDVTPVRNDGIGRTRFVRLANIAAICTTKKHIQSPQQCDDLEYALKNFHVERLDRNEGDYVSDATTETNISEQKYISKYHDADHELFSKNIRNISHEICTKLKTQGTQTDIINAAGNDKEDTNEIHDIGTTVDYVSKQKREEKKRQSDFKVSIDFTQRNFTKKVILPDYKKTNNDSLEIVCESQKGSSSKKRASLSDIEQHIVVSRNDFGNKSQSERKNPHDILPEKFIAQIDIDKERKQNIQTHANSLRNKVYWNPIKCDNQDNDGKDGLDGHKLRLPLTFERGSTSASDSEASINEDDPIY